jgi:hypothetical protein
LLTPYFGYHAIELPTALSNRPLFYGRAFLFGLHCSNSFRCRAILTIGHYASPAAIIIDQLQIY